MGFIRNHLRVLMAQNELNIQKVKEKTTLSRTTISNLYNSYSAGVQFDTMEQLCKLLKCQPGDLFEFVDVEITITEINEDIRTIKESRLDEDNLFDKKVEIKAQFMLEMLFNEQKSYFPFNIYAAMNVDKYSIDNCEIVLDNSYTEGVNKLKVQHYIEPYLHAQVQEQIINVIGKILNLRVNKKDVSFNIEN